MRAWRLIHFPQSDACQRAKIISLRSTALCALARIPVPKPLLKKIKQALHSQLNGYGLERLLMIQPPGRNHRARLPPPWLGCPPFTFRVVIGAGGSESTADARLHKSARRTRS